MTDNKTSKFGCPNQSWLFIKNNMYHCLLHASVSHAAKYKSCVSRRRKRDSILNVKTNTTGFLKEFIVELQVEVHVLNKILSKK